MSKKSFLEMMGALWPVFLMLGAVICVVTFTLVLRGCPQPIPAPTVVHEDKVILECMAWCESYNDFETVEDYVQCAVDCQQRLRRGDGRQK